MEESNNSPDIVKQIVEEITSDPGSDHDSIQDTMEEIGKTDENIPISLPPKEDKKFNKFESWLIQNI